MTVPAGQGAERPKMTPKRRRTIYVPCELRGDTLIVRRCMECGSLPEATVDRVQGRLPCGHGNVSFDAQTVRLDLFPVSDEGERP